MLEITVRDEGRGMTKEESIHVVDPFYTARPSAGGTGLGLSITRAIVCQHRDRKEVKSQPDVGTSVTISLPRSRQSGAGERNLFTILGDGRFRNPGSP